MSTDERTAKREAIARAREAWATREFGEAPLAAESRMVRWVNLAEWRVFYGPNASRKARADIDGAPF